MQVRAPSLISTMVTRTVICISPSEAATLAAEASWSSAEADSIIKKATTSTCYSNSSDNKSDGGKKRALPSEDIIGGNDSKKRQKADGFEIDLNDVPRQQPIPKSKRHMKEGSSKYAGVSFRKATNKWLAQILIEGTNRRIGDYENEEEAAIDYARAVFKYKGQEALNNLRQRNSSAPSIDLSDVPPQLPIPKSADRVKEGASKYAGVYFNKANNKWLAQIMIDRKLRHIGYFESEEAAAVDYARAVLKYKGQDALDKARARERKSPATSINLSDVPPQLPILKSKEHIKGGSSKYTGVTFKKASNKWRANIAIEGKTRHIGLYENEEEAAIDYARAVFKYQGQDALEKEGKQNKFALPKGKLTHFNSELETYVELQVGFRTIRVQQRGAMRTAPAQSSDCNTSSNDAYWGDKKRALPPDAKDSIIYEDTAMKHYERINASGMVGRGSPTHSLPFVHVPQSSSNTDRRFEIDLSDVPPQPPIPKNERHIKEGASKYTGVSFHKANNKWQSQIRIDGKQLTIGYYENEEEAAIDHARAVFKYKGQDVLDKKREQTSSAPSIDLTDVPPQQPIPKSKGRIKEGASKFTGVTFNKPMNKWQAQITFEGKKRSIGYYENEEEAAIDYARALFKYKSQKALNNLREPNSSAHSIDLSGVPPQQPIPKSEGHIKEGSSKYTGIYFNKAANKWQAQIKFEGKKHHIGLYENEEEAATEYARAVFKYKRQGALDKAGEQNSSGSGTVTSYSTSNNDAAYRYRGEKKRAPTSEASISYEETTAIKHQRINAFGKRNFLPHVIPSKASSVAATKASNISSAPIVQTNQQRSHYWHTPWQWHH